MNHSTPEELAAAGIDPQFPFARSERRVGEPGRWRIGDDLVTRRAEDGGVSVSIGYFSPFQTAMRAKAAAAFADAMRPSYFIRLRDAIDNV